LLFTEDAERVRAEHKAYLEAQLAATETWQPTTPMLADAWAQCVWPASDKAVRDPATGVDVKVLQEVGRASVAVPSDFVSVL
jgi:probable 2-oxoglutarate dehydrogenase E1 component DHKTD1